MSSLNCDCVQPDKDAERKISTASVHREGDADNLPPLAECINASFGYGRETVLEAVNLTVPRGVFWPIVGPNGAGKSTLLKGILGLLPPLAGTVRLHLNGDPPGYVPQGWKLDSIYPLTVGDVTLQGRFCHMAWHKRPDKEDIAIAKEALREVRLADCWDKNYRDLSGGMRQKVLIARALCYSHNIICLDEPTSEVDKPSELDILEHLYRLHNEKKMSVLLVCHAIGAVFNYADACLLVEHGKITIAKGETLKRIKESYV
ncbi:MAG TPA: ATP-binding cassette domain-containing protein [Elusimicrobiales bacterium]|nr:ATP-binding cassette domain-containing protein [Elusimicrobiales bacterium]